MCGREFWEEFPKLSTSNGGFNLEDAYNGKKLAAEARGWNLELEFQLCHQLPDLQTFSFRVC